GEPQEKERSEHHSLSVMPGLVPGIHVVCRRASKTWMARTSPAMTERRQCCTARSGMLGQRAIAVACKGAPASATNLKVPLGFQWFGAGGAEPAELLKDKVTWQARAHIPLYTCPGWRAPTP